MKLFGNRRKRSAPPRYGASYTQDEDLMEEMSPEIMRLLEEAVPTPEQEPEPTLELPVERAEPQKPARPPRDPENGGSVHGESAWVERQDEGYSAPTCLDCPVSRSGGHVFGAPGAQHRRCAQQHLGE